MRTVIPLDLSTDADLGRWQDYVLAHPDTQYADLGQWRRFFAALYGIRSLDFACVDDGRTVGVASLYLIASPFFGRILVTSPFFGASGGLHTDDAEARRALLEQIARAAEELDVDFVELRLRRPPGDPYVVHHGFLDFELPLVGSADDVWKKTISSSVRQNIRKSREFPLVFSTSREPAETYHLLARTIRDLGTPFHGRRFFDLVLEHLGDSVQFSHVRLEGKLVAAGLMVRYRDRVSTPFIGSLVDFRHTRANYCQYWGIIEHCLATGARTFDLGRSPRGSSHQQFKEKWGALPLETHYGHRVFSTRRAYRTVLDRSRFELWASGMWKHLPLFVTTRLGPRLARSIP